MGSHCFFGKMLISSSKQLLAVWLIGARIFLIVPWSVKTTSGSDQRSRTYWNVVITISFTFILVEREERKPYWGNEVEAEYSHPLKLKKNHPPKTTTAALCHWSNLLFCYSWKQYFNTLCKLFFFNPLGILPFIQKMIVVTELCECKLIPPKHSILLCQGYNRQEQESRSVIQYELAELFSTWCFSDQHSPS